MYKLYAQVSLEIDTTCDPVENVSSDGGTTILPQKHKDPFRNDEGNSDESEGHSDEVKKKTPKVVKNEDDLTPLPDPFPLPKYYRVDVQEALESRKMTVQTMSSFLSSVASSMYVYKRYSTRDDYITVARSVVQKY